MMEKVGPVLGLGRRLQRNWKLEKRKCNYSNDA